MLNLRALNLEDPLTSLAGKWELCQIETERLMSCEELCFSYGHMKQRVMQSVDSKRFRQLYRDAMLVHALR